MGPAFQTNPHPFDRAHIHVRDGLEHRPHQAVALFSKNLTILEPQGRREPILQAAPNPDDAEWILFFL
jgi:hypothetical protein